MIKFLFLKIICCRYFNPLNLFNVFSKILLFNLNIFKIFKTKDKFSLLPEDKKYSFFI